MKIAALFSILQFFLFSCSADREDMFGTYAAQRFVNTADTIRVYDNGTYERAVFDKNNRLALKMKGTWYSKGNLLTMNSFFLNLDRDIILYPELLSDTTMQMETLVERGLRGARFCTGYLPDESCYKKISQ